jgi:hypothetical protein
VAHQLERSLGAAELEVLWRSLCDEALAEAEVEAFFTLLREGCDTDPTTRERGLGKGVLVSKSLAGAVFSSYMCAPGRFNLLAAGPQALLCFQKFFLLANGFHNKIAYAGEEEPWVVNDTNLMGLSQLRTLALEAADDNAASAAAKFLLDLHLQLKEPVISNSVLPVDAVSLDRAAVWGTFVDFCMEGISSALAGGGGGGGGGPDRARLARLPAECQRRLRRSMDLLQALLREIDGLSTKASRLALKNWVSPTTNVYYKVNYKDLLLRATPLPTSFEGFGQVDVRMAAYAMKLNTQAVYTCSVTHDYYAARDELRVCYRPGVDTFAFLRDRLADHYGVGAGAVTFSKWSAGANKNMLFSVHEMNADLKPSNAWITIDVDKKALAHAEAAPPYMSPEDRLKRAWMIGVARLLEMDAPSEIDKVRQWVDEKLSRLNMDLESASAAPRARLATSVAHFDALFALLSVPDATLVRDAWELLCSLPEPEKVKDEVRLLRGQALAGGEDAAARNGRLRELEREPPVAWAEALDGTSPLRLLYCLNVAR